MYLVRFLIFYSPTKKLDQHIFFSFFILSTLGRKDSNLRMSVPKTDALPLGDAPFKWGPEAFSKKIKWVLLHKVLTRFFWLFLKNFGLKTNITIFKKKIKYFDVFLEAYQKDRNPKSNKVISPNAKTYSLYFRRSFSPGFGLWLPPIDSPLCC